MEEVPDGCPPVAAVVVAAVVAEFSRKNDSDFLQLKDDSTRRETDEQ